MTGALLALLATGAIDSVALPVSGPLECRFQPESGAAPISLRVAPVPMQHATGLHGVEMTVDDKMTLQGVAGAITTTPQRDVMIRGMAERRVIYTLGVAENGDAALNVLWATTKESPLAQVTHIGRCHDAGDLIGRWLGP
ncbi:MAG: hypothetical protein AAFR35_07365 [Pseudomonadota bacterium]